MTQLKHDYTPYNIKLFNFHNSKETDLLHCSETTSFLKNCTEHLHGLSKYRYYKLLHSRRKIRGNCVWKRSMVVA